MKSFQRDKHGRIDWDASGFKEVHKHSEIRQVKWFWGQWPEAPWKKRRAWNKFWKRVQIVAARRGWTRLHQLSRRFVRWT